jgi:hypothetical protein
VLRHFDSHYVVSICAILPFAFLPILAQRRIRWIAAAGILAGLGFTGLHAAREFSQESRAAAAIMEDETKILAMPLLPGEARLWTYRVPSEKFAAAFVAAFSGVEPLIAALADPARQDFSSYSRINRPYRYIVLDRKHFQDADAVRKTQGPLDPTQAVIVHLAPEDQIHMLKRLIVVEKHGPWSVIILAKRCSVVVWLDTRLLAWARMNSLGEIVPSPWVRVALVRTTWRSAEAL